MASKRRRSPSKPKSKTPEDIWLEQPNVIRSFIEKRPDFEQLCAEVAYILTKKLNEKDVEISTVTWRAKTLTSFLEKIQRKQYVDPFAEITDFAGARVVCLYITDINVIENIIRREFDVIEKVDKLTDKGADRFGYGAIHFIVKLGKGSAGARYDDLKDLVCEIQVRTVLQDAWAIIDHHLVYKNESDVPTQLQRKLNSLAGLFETADDQFDRVRTERESYLADVRDSRKIPEQFLDNELNKDSFTEYLKWKFPELPLEKFPGQLDLVFYGISKKKYPKLLDIDKLLEKTKQTREKINKKIQGEDSEYKKIAPIEIALALGIVDKNFREDPAMPELWRKAIDENIQ